MKYAELIGKMTLQEKAEFCSGIDFWHLAGNERLGIPSIMVTDGPHGLRKKKDKKGKGELLSSVPAVCFPTACLTACSWDPDLLREMGEALGEECLAERVSILLGPGVNIKRSPLCGRNFEYFSEDPLLSGRLAAALASGIQSQ
ncbi:MAG TPA: glycoside hydrolase family 3 N-terminal domain-containing protein, partial [Clostridiales bacterium]|nr:glycoside hydrolase family 3 N-terminal domain-containing protein [Clostridiales bacterium]